MKVAIIEDNLDFRELLKTLLQEHDNWEITFFVDSADFGKANLEGLDVIVADYMLPTMNGRDLLRSVSTKSSAQMFLMSADNQNFLKEDIDADHIAGLIDKTNVQNVIDQLKYADTKIRINKYIELEKDKFVDILNQQNGYTLETKDGILIIGLSTPLTDENRKFLDEKINTGNYKGIVYFPKKNMVPSILLGELIHCFKTFREQNKNFAFWNATQSKELEKQLIMCSLDKLFRIFNSLEDAIQYLSSPSS